MDLDGVASVADSRFHRDVTLGQTRNAAWCAVSQCVDLLVSDRLWDVMVVNQALGQVEPAAEDCMRAYIAGTPWGQSLEFLTNKVSDRAQVCVWRKVTGKVRDCATMRMASRLAAVRAGVTAGVRKFILRSSFTRLPDRVRLGVVVTGWSWGDR
jgi:hypothetical protein